MPHRVKGRHKPRHHTHADKPIRPLPQPSALKTSASEPVAASVATAESVPTQQVTASPFVEETTPSFVAEETASANEEAMPASVNEETAAVPVTD